MLLRLHIQQGLRFTLNENYKYIWTLSICQHRTIYFKVPTRLHTALYATHKLGFKVIRAPWQLTATPINLSNSAEARNSRFISTPLSCSSSNTIYCFTWLSRRKRSDISVLSLTLCTQRSLETDTLAPVQAYAKTTGLRARNMQGRSNCRHPLDALM